MPISSRPAAIFPIPVFFEELSRRLDAHAQRRSRSARGSVVVVFPDQLSLEIGPLRTSTPHETTVVLFESGEWLSRRPYHRQRLGWILR